MILNIFKTKFWETVGWGITLHRLKSFLWFANITTSKPHSIKLFIFEIKNLTDDVKEAYLLVECPRQLFPFARRIIYDMHSDGGLPPLMLDPVNFADLYEKRKKQN